METNPNKIRTRPPRLLEAAVGALIPLRRRENVLGDLHRHYVSVGPYLRHAADTVPLVVKDEVRRSFNMKLVAGQACILYITTIGASLSLPILPMIIILAVALTVLVLRDAYTHPIQGSPEQAVADGVVTATFMFAAGMVLEVAAPSINLPTGMLIRGTAIGLLVVSSLRHLFWRARLKGIDGEDQRDRQAGQAYRWTWRMNAVWIIGCLADVLTRPEMAGRDVIRMIPIMAAPMIATALVAWLQKQRFAEVPNYTPLVLSRPAYQTERHSSDVLFFLFLLVLPMALVMENWMVAATSREHWLRAWTNLIVLLGMAVYWRQKFWYSSEKR